MIIGKKYCFTCGISYELDDAHDHHVCMPVSGPQAPTLEEIRQVVREEISQLAGHLHDLKAHDPHISSWPPRVAVDGDI
jgi:hypothetical protein